MKEMTIIVQRKKHVIDLDTLSRRDLLNWEMRLEAEIVNINGQLERAGVDVEGEDAYDENAWHIKAKYARAKLLGALIEVREEIRGKSTEQPSGTNGSDLGKLFMNIARVRLDHELFNEILYDAKELQYEKQQAS